MTPAQLRLLRALGLEDVRVPMRPDTWDDTAKDHLAVAPPGRHLMWDWRENEGRWTALYGAELRTGETLVRGGVAERRPCAVGHYSRDRIRITPLGREALRAHAEDE